MKLLRLCLFIAAVVVMSGAFASFAEVKAQGPEIIQSLLKLMEQNRKSLTSMKANLKTEKYNSQLDEKEIRDGAVLYLPNKNTRKPNVRIDFEKPNETISMIDGKVKAFRPDLNVCYVRNADSAKNNVGNALEFMNMSTAQLKQNYQAEWLGNETVGNNFSTYKLRLTPRNDSVTYKYAEIWIDEKGMPVQAKVTEKSGDYNTFLLYNIERNAKITKSQIQISLPKGVKEIAG